MECGDRDFPDSKRSDGAAFFRRYVNVIDRPYRLNSLRAFATGMAVMLFAKVFLSILYQYRWYFPADFDSDFLSVRRDIFHGPYRAAFYAHIVSAPIALSTGIFLIVSGHDGRLRKIHRWAGRLLAVVVFAFVTPSALVMAAHAPAGAFAGSGLATLAIGTAACLIMAIRHARRGHFRTHQRWATRCFILLGSPLLLRLITGFVIVTRLDPVLWDSLNPWVSWLFPLISYEVWWRYAERTDSARVPVSIWEARP
jgi:uncharacterized membrane protein